MKKLKSLSLLVSLLLLSVTTFAQDCSEGPGLPGIDPDAVNNGCPLDTWVVALVVVAVMTEGNQGLCLPGRPKKKIPQ